MRSNSQAFACRRVCAVSYETLTFAPEADKLVQGPLLGRARVHARDDAHVTAAEQEVRELPTDQAEAREPNERAEEVDPIGALDLERDLGPDL